MPITVRKFNAQVKDPNTGDMVPAGLLSSDALGAIESAKNDAVTAVEGKQAVAEAAVELKGQTTLASIPDDYTELSNEVDDVKTQLGVVYTYNPANKTTGVGIEIAKFYPTSGHNYKLFFYNLIGVSITLYEYDTGGNYTTLSQDNITTNQMQKDYTPTDNNVDYLRVYVGAPSGETKGGSTVICDLNGENILKNIDNIKNDLADLEEDFTEASAENDSKFTTILTASGIVESGGVNNKTTGAGVELTKFYATHGVNYQINFYDCTGNMIYLYEFYEDNSYIIYAELQLGNKTEWTVLYTPTNNNVTYVRLYIGAPAGTAKGGKYNIYQISNNNQSKEIRNNTEQITKLGLATDYSDIIATSLLDNGGIAANGDFNDNVGMIRFSDFIEVQSGTEYKISLETSHTADINNMYCATYNSSKVLQSRIVIDGTEKFRNAETNECGYFITIPSGITYIKPYFYSSIYNLTKNDISKVVVSKSTSNDIKILECGDSICRGARNSGEGFAGQIGYRYKNIGVGNSSLATNNGTGVENIPNTFKNDSGFTPDVIISDGGINDYIYSSPLGTAPSEPITTDEEAEALDRTTVVGGAAYLFYQMVKKYPNAKRYFLITHKTLRATLATPQYCPATQNTANYTQRDLHDMLVQICNLYGVKIIDVYNDSIIDTKFEQYRSPVAWSSDPSTANNYMVDDDGVHPTIKGYEDCYAPMVLKTIKY